MRWKKAWVPLVIEVEGERTVYYSLRPKKQVILGILGQINKKVKMTMFAPIYYPYLALIDSYMRMHFLNRVR